MMQPQALCHQQKFQLLEMLYMRQPNGQRIRPSTKAVLYLLADCQAALHWSNARIAEHIGYSLRTVARAMVELRETGILTSFRKRRRDIAHKRLDVSKAVHLVGIARQKAQQISTIAVGFLRRGLEVPRKELSNLWVSKKPEKVVIEAPKPIAPMIESRDEAALEEALARFQAVYRPRT